MPELIEDSEMFLSGSGEVSIDTGTPDDLSDEAHQRINGTRRFLEAFRQLTDKLDRDAAEQRQRTSQPPVSRTPLAPVKAVDNSPPLEVPPPGGDAPALQGAPDLAIPQQDSVVLNTTPQSSQPLVSAKEPSHTAYDPLNPIAPEDIANLLAVPPADFDAFITRLKRNQNEPGERHPTHAAPAARTRVAKGDPVDLFTGAFTIAVLDLTVPTPFIPIAMSRSYRSGRPYFGPFGYGWDHVYNVYLRPLNDGSFALWTGQLQEQHFRKTGSDLEPEPGFSCRMERTPGLGEVFSVQFPGGTQWLFERPAAWSDVERIPLVTIRDRHGNAVHLTYGPINRVVSVLDDAGRGLLFTYGGCQLLERVTDHMGQREVRYEHDPEIEHLVNVVLPATSQYPKGLSTAYEYASYDPHPAMRHNIVRVTDAAGRLMVENDYAGPDTGWEFNSVVRQRMAGFEYQFGYQQIQYVAPDPGNVDALASRTQVMPPDGSLHTYTFNYRGDLLDHRFRLNRDGSFRVVSRSWQYDLEGNVIEAVKPDGLRTVLTFDAANPDPCARRNLLKVELVSPFPDIDPSRIVYRGTYDPRFQLPVRTQDESGVESGVETIFQYDFDVVPFGSTGRLRQVELPAVTGADGVSQQSALTFEHNAQGQLTATISAEQNRTEFLYLSGGLLDGFLSTITRDPSGANLVTAVQYDASGFPMALEAPGGRTSRFLHNALGQVEQLTSPLIAGQDAKVRRFFDDSGLVVRVERPVGSYQGSITGSSIVDEYERDEGGHVRRTIAASNTADRREWLYRMDHEGRDISVWDPLGIRMDRSFGEDGSLLSETAAASESEAQTVSYDYDRAGRLTRMIDEWKCESRIEYDVWGRPHKITLPLGAIWTLTYGVNDRLLEERLEEESVGTLVLRQRQTYDYDRRGRLTFATRFSFRDDPTLAVPLTARYLYDKDNRMREMMLPQGARYRYACDTAGRLSEVLDLHGNIRRFVYGPAGDLAELVSIESENGVTRTAKQLFEYDDRGRLLQSTLFQALAKFRYDDRNLPIEHRGPNGVTRQAVFNAHGQLVEKIEDPAKLFMRSQFEYDLNGRLNRYVDPTGRITTWERDAIGRTTTLTPPDGAPWKYVFDDKTRSTSQRTPAGNEVVYESPDTSPGTVNVTAFAAPGQTPVPQRKLVFDGLGRLVGASLGSETIQRQYDSLGRLIEETAQGKTVRMEYDDTVSSMDLIYPDGRRERTERNPAGQPTRITLVTPGDLGGTPGDVLLEIRYSEAGRPDHVVYGNGVAARLVHDDNDRMIRIEYRMNGVLLDSCRLRYDDNGHRALVQYLGAPARNLIHDFDGAGRLAEVRTDFPLAPLADQTAPIAQTADVKDARGAAATAPGVDFILDAADARTEQKRLDGTNDEKYALGSDHRVLAAGSDAISYNLDGHRTLDSRYIYQLDALNRVSIVRDRVTNAILAELHYDALSRVSAGSTDGQSFERWFAGDLQIHETSGAISKQMRQHSAHPLWAIPFCVTDAAGVAFMHQDEGLSTMCLTDAGGQVIERHRYQVFGAASVFGPDGVTPVSTTRSEPIWRGMTSLGTTKMFRTPSRLYDPELGVFASRDPLLYADSPSPYVYAAQNPVDFADPTGLAKSPLGAKGFSISPPPPISRDNDTLLFREGDWWRRYEADRRQAEKPNPDLKQAYEGMIIAPIAYLEEFVRGILNTPHSVVNGGTHGGEHVARAYLWIQQDEWAEAVAEGAEAVATFSLAFLDLAFLGEAGAGSKGKGAVARVPTAPSPLPEVVIHYDPIFAANPEHSNWYRFVVEALQEHQGGSLTRVLGQNEKRLATDGTLRARARAELKRLGFDLSDLQAGHPADSIINPYIQAGDVGTTYYFMESRVNGRFGNEFGQQLNILGVEKGGRFRVTFTGPWPNFAEFPPIAPLASSPGLR